MIELVHTGIVSKIIYLCPKTGFCVFILSTNNGKKKKEVKCVGNRVDLTKGSSVVVKGVIQSDSRGEQLKCSSIQVRLMEDSNTLKAFLASSYIKGVGEATAGRIVEMFGSDTKRVIEEESHKLLKIKGITQERLDLLVESYHKAKNINQVYEFLAPAGATGKTVGKIFKEYGDEAMPLLLEDCYRLCLDLDGFGFIKSDVIALGIGYSRVDPRRVDSAINYVLKTESESSGDVYIEESVLIKKSVSLLGISMDDVIERLNLIVKSVSRLGITHISHEGMRYYAYTKHKNQEDYIALTVARLLKEKSAIKVEASPFKLVIDRLIGNGVTPTPEQYLACKTALENKISVISGGPGTGKTTISKVVADTLNEIGANFIILGPTGKATVRISQKSGYKARTIASFLRKKEKADYVIVDESSMINYDTANWLFRRLPNAHFVFIGDKGQLPAIGVGDFFRSLCDLELIPKVNLTVAMRQGEDSGIIPFISGITHDEINIKSLQTKEDLESEDALLIEFKDKANYIKKFPSLYMSLLKKYPDLQVITCRKDGDFGTKNLNKILREVANPDIGQASVGTKTYNFRIGDRVIITENDLFGAGVANGDTGVISGIREIKEEFQKYSVADITLDDGREVTCDDLFVLDLAYALTVHKTQGSEYEAVIFTPFSEAYILLSKNIVYTACSRPQKKLIVYGEKKALKMALSKGDVGKRFTFLADRITANYSKKSKGDDNDIKSIA